MANSRDRFTTASADPGNAAADYPVELVAVEDVADKIFNKDRDSGRLAAHIKAARLINSFQ